MSVEVQSAQSRSGPAESRKTSGSGSFGRCKGQSRRVGRECPCFDWIDFRAGSQPWQTGCVKPKDGVPDDSSNSCDGVSELRGKL